MMNKSRTISSLLGIGIALPLLLMIGAQADQKASIQFLGITPAGNVSAISSIVTNTCSACHGIHGNSLMPQYPNLAGQNQSYLIKQLADFHRGVRANPIMQAMVATIPADHFTQDIDDLAYYFSRQPLNPQVNANSRDPKAPLKVLKLGEQIYRSGIPHAGVPACMACHEANGMGNAPMAIPRLAGQHSAYLITQLQQFQDGQRSNDPHSMMRAIANKLTSKEIKAVSFYLQSLNPKLILGNAPHNFKEMISQRKGSPLIGIPANQIASDSHPQAPTRPSQP